MPDEPHVPSRNCDASSPLYQQVMTQIRHWLTNGTLQRGDVLPAYRQLGPQLGVSEITIRRAVQELTRQGLLVSRPGSGTFVANISSPPTFAALPHESVVKNNGASDPPLVQIGMVLGQEAEGSPYLSRSVEGIRHAIHPSTLLRFFEQPGGDWREAAKFAESLPLGDLAGVLMYSPVNLELLVRCRRADVPVVLLWNDVADSLTSCVTCDLAAGVLQAVQHLVNTGRRRFAMVTATARRSTSARLAAALHMSLAACDIKTPGKVIAQPGHSEADGYEATGQLLAKRKGPTPDAILYVSDQQAIGGIKACGRRSIPDDVAIVGMGNVLAPDDCPLPLTTIDLRAQEVGRLAAKKLQDLQSSGGRLPLRQEVVPNLVIRRSS